MLELQHRNIKISDEIKSMGISDICIWGRGRICDYLINEFQDGINIRAIVESIPKTAVYKGIPVIQYKDISWDVSIVIVIPGYDFERIKNMVDLKGLNCRLIAINELIDQIRGDNQDE